jgi:hypothetical protein
MGRMGMGRRKEFPSQGCHGTVMPLSRSSAGKQFRHICNIQFRMRTIDRMDRVLRLKGVWRGVRQLFFLYVLPLPAHVNPLFDENAKKGKRQAQKLLPPPCQTQSS